MKPLVNLVCPMRPLETPPLALEFSEKCTEAPLWGIRAVPELECRKLTNKHSFAGKDAEHAIIDAGKRALSVASEPLFSRTVL
jgi:hypothetical protein